VALRLKVDTAADAIVRTSLRTSKMAAAVAPCDTDTTTTKRPPATLSNCHREADRACNQVLGNIHVDVVVCHVAQVRIDVGRKQMMSCAVVAAAEIKP
jgi:hypothetical protein